ncbi:MAG TPA: heavy metal-binding domain-containing protein [Acidiferrobacter sp.]|nr:heavy metal-binding domain-containing protein [Acidiferrobacter sp.]
MSRFDRPGKGLPDEDAGRARQSAWDTALSQGSLPAFVKERLAETASGKRPWVTTASPAGLLAQRSHGIRPLGLVSGNCWFHYGYSWTRGHYEGWHTAIDRLRLEAALMGANAVVDVTMQVKRMPGEGNGDHMDYAVSGTAVRIDGLPESANPALATVSALEFARLLESGIVPVGIAIGAYFNWFVATGYSAGNALSFWNQELGPLSTFLTQVRRQALQELRDDGMRLGSGVLAHTQHSELYRIEADENNPYTRFLARHIALGTAIIHDSRTRRPFGVRPVLNVRDSALLAATDTTKEAL